MNIIRFKSVDCLQYIFFGYNAFFAHEADMPTTGIDHKSAFDIF